MTVGVVILNWNGRKLFEQFLPSVAKHSSGAVIYVADNASTDDSVDFVRQNYPQIKIIQNTSNLGYAAGYNEALKSVGEDIYVLVNSDVEVTENWLQPAIDAFIANPQISIIQPKILDFKQKNRFEYAGAAGGFIDKYGYPFCRGRIFSTTEADHHQYNDSPIFWASGACFFIRKEVFDELGGFDRDFFAHQEEIDLCWRAFNRNHVIWHCSNSKVYHVGGATLHESKPHKTYLNFRNSLCMLAKNLPSDHLLPIILSRLVLDGIAGIKFLFQLKPAHCFSIIHAHFSFYATYTRFRRKREKYQRTDYYRINSIVWQYFVKGKKVFRELI